MLNSIIFLHYSIVLYHIKKNIICVTLYLKEKILKQLFNQTHILISFKVRHHSLNSKDVYGIIGKTHLFIKQKKEE